MIITKAPLRISFFGGGTDFPEWYLKHGGAVLSVTIDKYCFLTVRRRRTFQSPRFRLMYSKVEDVNFIDQIKHPTTREILRLFEVDFGLEIHHDADLPARSGLGSSSAFTVSLMLALRKGAYQRKPFLLAQHAFDIERKRVGEFGGVQDSLASACGGMNFFSFSAEAISREHVSYEITRPLEHWVMLAYVGDTRTGTSTDVHKTMEFGNHFHHMTALTRVAYDTLISCNYAEFGRLLHEAWLLKKLSNPKTSSTEIEFTYNAMRSLGALGGKICGAGAGGFMVIIAPPEKHQYIKEQLPHVHFVDCRFSFTGAEVIYKDE